MGAIAFVTIPATATAQQPSLGQYSRPADAVRYVQPGGAWSPKPCWNPKERQVQVFEHNGAGMAKVDSLSSLLSGRQGVLFTSRAGQAVVWNMNTQRVRNYTRQPILAALWCSPRR